MLLHRPLSRIALLTIIATGQAPLTLAEPDIYRTRDEQGRVIFSDKASESAEPVTLPPTNTMTELAPATPPAAADSTTPEEPFAYETLAIVSPADGDAIFSPVGQLIVGVSVTPPLQPGHSLDLLLDGAPAGTPQEGAFKLEGLVRGPHTLQLQIVDADGEVVQSSSAVTVHLQRAAHRRVLPLQPPAPH